MPVNIRPVDPLAHNVPIVDAQGRPTPQFMRQWELARNINLTVDDVTVSITEIDDTIAVLQRLVADLRAVRIIAGAGLSGGGDLTEDRTLDLEDTAVTPGTYGSATEVPKLTVNSRGQITHIEAVEIVLGP